MRTAIRFSVWQRLMENTVQGAPAQASNDGPVPQPASVFGNLSIGVLLILLPTAVYYLWFCMSENHGQPALPSLSMVMSVPAPTITSIAIVTGWIAFQAALQIFAPGSWVNGPELSDGRRLAYKMNGWAAWWITWIVLGSAWSLGQLSPTILADQLGPLLSTVNVIALCFSGYLFWRGRRSPSSQPRNRRDFLHDFWLGTELNPRIGRFDLKLFFEARPGLIGWVAIDLSCAAKQYQLAGTVTVPMMLVCAFQLWYVADYFWNERAILTTWDIKYEKFGGMLCWGDLVWVPFTYSLQAQYLVTQHHDLPWMGIVGIVALNSLGYAIFRGANLQKNRFRDNPARPIWGKPPRIIITSRGNSLLLSGWWGFSRHMNYLGDFLMGVAWSLPTLFGSPLPYFYCTYFGILLLHRERRDYWMCAARYGADWDRYCAAVPYRIVPWLY